MHVEEYIATLRREAGLVVAAVERADLDAVPSTTPEWTVRELAHHLGRVHRWAATYVRDERPTMMSPDEDELCWGPMPDDRDLVAWLHTGCTRLADALARAEPTLACWSFLPSPSPLAFWARRQAHETTIHRVDAQSLTGALDPVDRTFAVDGIDELLLCFFSRPRNRLRLPWPRRLAVLATDVDASWMVHIGPDGARAERAPGPADAEVSGAAVDLYLGLWNRTPLGDLQLEGDAELVAAWRDKATVRWT